MRTMQQKNSYDHCRAVCLRESKRLADAWGTRLGTPEECVATMCMVELPKVLAPSVGQPGRPDEDGLRDTLRNRFGVEAAVGSFGDSAWIRVSAAVYNSESDFRKLREAVLQCARDLQEAKHL